jgi:GNAT superfamily N-acetyltransferase
MAKETSVRPAEPADTNAVATVFLAARATMSYLPDLHTDEETFGWIANQVLVHDEVFVAEEDDAILGFAALQAEFLEHLYVHPDHHRRGIGTVLLALAISVRPGGFRLWVFQKNTEARRFYEARGLRLIELTDGADNEEQEPDALYEWRPRGAEALD